MLLRKGKEPTPFTDCKSDNGPCECDIGTFYRDSWSITFPYIEPDEYQNRIVERVTLVYKITVLTNVLLVTQHSQLLKDNFKIRFNLFSDTDQQHKFVLSCG